MFKFTELETQFLADEAKKRKNTQSDLIFLYVIKFYFKES